MPTAARTSSGIANPECEFLVADPGLPIPAIVSPMEVFVIPIGRDRYELYCEAVAEPPSLDPAAKGIVGRIRHRFAVMLHQAEERQRSGAPSPAAESTWLTRAQEHLMAWVAERVAEQRLLWNLRHESAVVAAHPQDLTFEETLVVIRRRLQRDHDRHRLWLAVDGLLLIASAALMLIPGPNIVAYYFAFRLMGHWLSMRGAAQGLRGIAWTGRPCEPLTELRDVGSLDEAAREQRVHEIGARLHLQHLSSFFERVAIRHA